MKVHSTVLSFRNKAVLICGILLGVLTISCEEEYPEAMFINSVIQGRIQLGFSSEGTLDNFLVAAHGPYEKETSLTNSNGNFEITGLGNGTYKLEISKAGYGTKYAYGIQLFGNDTVGVFIDEIYELALDRMPKLLSVETRLTSYSWLQENDIAITTNKTSGTVAARVFMADYKGVNYKNYQWTAEARSLHRNGYENMMFHVEDIPFESGKKIYLILYICNQYDRGYLNYSSGLWTFSTLDPDEHSEEMSFTMP